MFSQTGGTEGLVLYMIFKFRAHLSAQYGDTAVGVNPAPPPTTDWPVVAILFTNLITHFITLKFRLMCENMQNIHRIFYQKKKKRL